MRNHLFGSMTPLSALALCAFCNNGHALAIENADSPEAIKDSYIVVFKQPASSATAASISAAIEAEYGARATSIYREVFSGAALTLGIDAAKRLLADPRVEAVYADTIVRPLAVPSGSWGLDRIDQRSLPLNGQYSYNTWWPYNVHAYVIDTGVRSSHSEFLGRMARGADLSPDGPPDEGDPGTSPLQSDPAGHGTHVASTFAGSTWGVARYAQIHSIKIFNDAGFSTLQALLDALEWIWINVEYPAVVNVSVGTPATAVVDQAIETLLSAGIVVVAAAGNDGGDACLISPARTPEAITVAAVDFNDMLAPFSNRGPCVDISAPGVNIVAAHAGNDSDSKALSGTSMAAPHVAGAAAIYLSQNPWASPHSVRNWLVSQAGSSGVVTVRDLLMVPPVAPAGLLTFGSCYGENAISWRATPEAHFYELWVDTTRGFTNPVRYDSTTGTTSVQNFEGERWLKVRACNERGCGPLTGDAIKSKYRNYCA